MFKLYDIDSMVLCLTEGNIQLLETLSGESTQPKKQPSSILGQYPPPSRSFTGREDILEQMRSYFLEGSPLERRLFVLCGLGGAGKTQLALKFVQLRKGMYVNSALGYLSLRLTTLCRFSNIFYIDATTRETISSGLTALAKAAGVGETPEEALK